MFVSKKKYNEALIELIDTRTELKHKDDELKQCKAQLKDIDARISTLENRTVEKGKRLTEEELSTLIAVDLIKILDKEAAESPISSDAERKVVSEIISLCEGLGI